MKTIRKPENDEHNHTHTHTKTPMSCGLDRNLVVQDLKQSHTQTKRQTHTQTDSQTHIGKMELIPMSGGLDRKGIRNYNYSSQN